MADEAMCASWLWAHDRWKNQDNPRRRLRLEAKRNLLGEDVRERGLPTVPRNTRIWVRMPNWLGDVVMAVPLIRALRVSRPDAEITLLASPAYAGLLESFQIADRIRPLPARGLGYFSHFAALRAQYPDTWILLTNSTRGDLEARIAGCPQRFGIVRQGASRPFLSHSYAVPAGFDEALHHQLDLWRDFLGHFGMAGAPDLSVTHSHRAGAGGPIGLIAGSENNPSKRWPVEKWRQLIEALPDERFVLFGTSGDAAITAQVCAGFDPDRVSNQAGRTSLTEFAAGLGKCRLLVSNDTGGMHLANALGVPLIALFGPTNPIRTRPVFSAPCTVLQPAGCPPTGGMPLSALHAAQVIDAVRNLPTRP
jgi:ADP-heptose:LPS heptosyltransferase